MIKSMTNRMTFLFRFIVAAAFMAVVTSSSLHAQNSIFDTSSSFFSNDDEFLKVDEAFDFNFDQSGNVLTIKFDIAEGYYLYRHQFKFTAENAELEEITLPKGEDHEDEFFGVQQVYRGELSLPINIIESQKDGQVTIKFQGCADKGLCYPPKRKTLELGAIALENAEKSNSNDVLSALSEADNGSNVADTSSTAEPSEQHRLVDSLKNDSVMWVLLAFFAGGLLLSFTPCVFPMYPILTGIIVGQGENLTTKKAFGLSFAYVQGMAITYTLLGIVVALAGAQFQAMFQHPIVLIGLSILFIFLALSMFGVFNLALPSSWQNKLNSISNNQKGGSFWGVLAMGAISGLVASPCTTAPLTGALLYISQTGDIALGASALYALSLGMGIPLLVLGSSGGKLLPKAGAWMDIIKNIFGLLLLAVPIFLLERFLPPLTITLLWSVLALASATYFYVQNQQSAPSFWYGVRSLFILLVIIFTAQYTYNEVFPAQNATVQDEQEHGFVHVASLSELNDLVAKSNTENKTVMVDLYADWCIACKDFEKYTFPAPEVVSALSNTVLVQIDLTDTGSEASIELMGHFEVFGLPSILFFDKSGQELTQQRVTGFMGAEEFAKHVRSIF